jgi:hypothetical protein
MNEVEHIKTQIIEALHAVQDADLLDLVYKLLLTEGSNNAFNDDLILCG